MATYGRTQLGGTAFNHSQSQASEQEYDRLRNLARQEHAKMQSCFDRVSFINPRSSLRMFVFKCTNSRVLTCMIL